MEKKKVPRKRFGDDIKSIHLFLSAAHTCYPLTASSYYRRGGINNDKKVPASPSCWPASAEKSCEGALHMALKKKT